MRTEGDTTGSLINTEAHSTVLYYSNLLGNLGAWISAGFVSERSFWASDEKMLLRRQIHGRGGMEMEYTQGVGVQGPV